MVLEQIELWFNEVVTVLWYFSEVFSAVELTKQRLGFRMMNARDENLFPKQNSTPPNDDDMTWYTESFSTFYQASVSGKAWLEIPARCDF